MKPSVFLVDYQDNREQAWKFSRPGFNHSDINMEEIGGMDMSLNRLCMLTFEVQSSLIFRDWLFSIRPIFPWARSSRSAPLTPGNTNISNEFGCSGAYAVEQVLERVRDGMPQDKARESLPMTMSTAFTFTIDFRSCIGMLKAMKELDEEMYNVYGEQFEYEIKHIPGAIDNQIKSTLNRYLLTEDELSMQGTEEAGVIIAGAYDMKAALMAQFLRTSNAVVKASLWNDINDEGYKMMFYRTQSDKFKVVFYMDKDVYHNLMRTRSHWFADWNTDMWGTMVGDYISDLTLEEFWDFIPNGNGKKDPYHRDMMSRILGEEHNLPCPIMTECPQFIYDRLDQQGYNPVIGAYTALAEAGFINDNPDNKFRRQYEQLSKD